MIPKVQPVSLVTILILALTSACGQTPTPASTPVAQTPGDAPAATTSTPSITVTPAEQAVAAGSSTRIHLAVSPHADTQYRFATGNLPAGADVELLGDPAPYNNTMIVHTTADLAPGRYVFDVSVTLPETPTLSGMASVVLNVVACSGFQPGEFTQSVSDRLVTIIPAGKPARAEGLLIPLQICGPAQEQVLDVMLVSAVSEAGTPMSTPPPFYLYRSLVWPAPEGQITAHAGNYWGIDVVLPRIDGTGWSLSGTVSPGLYLLVFERTHWGGSTDPADVPATVTYRLALSAGP